MAPSSTDGKEYQSAAVSGFAARARLYYQPLLRATVYRPCARGLGAAAPQAAVAPEDEGHCGLVIGPARVFRQLHLFLRRLPTFPCSRLDLHSFRDVLQEGQLILCVFLGA